MSRKLFYPETASTQGILHGVLGTVFHGLIVGRESFTLLEASDEVVISLEYSWLPSMEANAPTGVYNLSTGCVFNGEHDSTGFLIICDNLVLFSLTY